MILAFILGFFIVSVALGFGLGWYVRGAYPRRLHSRVIVDLLTGKSNVEPPLPRKATLTVVVCKQNGDTQAFPIRPAGDDVLPTSFETRKLLKLLKKCRERS